MIQDGDFTTANNHGPPEIEYPLRDHPDHYIVTRKVRIFPANYSGAPLDTADSSYTSAYCIGDTRHTTVGPLLQFERRFATIPQDRDFNGAQSVSYPAFGSSTTSAAYSLIEQDGRAYQRFNDYEPRASSLTLTVPVRKHVEFYLPGVNIESIQEIPTFPKFRVANSSGVTVANLEASGADPDAATYKSWIAAGVEIVAVGTRITNYLGNIWRAETTWAKAR